MSSIYTVPCRCTYSTILSAKSGSVSTLFSHHSKTNNDCMNTSTWPSSGHNSTCSAVSSWIVQHGHLLLRPLRCLQGRFLFVAAMFITCLHVHTWNGGQHPVHLWPIYFIKCICEHSRRFVKERACNLPACPVSDVCPHVRGHLCIFHEYAYWF